MSDLPTREEAQWCCTLVARHDPLTESEATTVSAIVKAYAQCEFDDTDHGEPLMTRSEWESTMTEEERIGIEVDVGDGPVRPKWKRLVTEWEPNGVVDAAVKGAENE